MKNVVIVEMVDGQVSEVYSDHGLRVIVVQIGSGDADVTVAQSEPIQRLPRDLMEFIREDLHDRS